MSYDPIIRQPLWLMHYEAFISYSHNDEKQALWIQRKLESYRIPRRLVDELKLAGNRFLPVFRDKDELASSANLSETLRTALQASRNLIVICSPSSANSRWVNEEVAEFQRLGRSDRIFCVIVGGEPGDPASCFPSKLRAAEPLAMDLRSGGENRSAVRLRLVASLLDIGLDRLRQRDAQRRRRRLLYQAMVSGAAAAMVAGLSYRYAIAPPCHGSQTKWVDVWNSQVQTGIQQAFLMTGIPYAEEGWKLVLERLDRYASSWTATHQDACEATLVRGEQSPELMDLRMACLDLRQTEFAGLTKMFANADVHLVERAVDMTGELPSLARCNDRAQLLAAFPLPDDPTKRLGIATLRDDLSNARARLAAGALGQVRDAVNGYVVSAEDYAYPPLEAEALLLKGNVEQQSGHHPAAKDTFYAAAAKAVLARETELVAQAWIALSDLLVDNEGDPEEAIDILEVAKSYIAQLPMDQPLAATFHEARSRALRLLGDFDQVVKEIRIAVDISRAANHPALSVYLGQLSNVLRFLHQLDEAQSTADEAIASAETTFGRLHPNYASALISAAGIATVRGNHADALNLRRTVLETTEAAYPAGHPRVVTALERFAWSLKETGSYEDAILVSDRALALENAFETPRWGVISTLHNTIGDTHISLGNYPMAMLSLEAALRSMRKSGDKPGIGLALNNLGNVANRAGEHLAAEAFCRDAVAVDETYLSANHPDLGYALSCRGEALLGMHKPTEALSPLSRAHLLRDRLDVAQGSLAWTRWLYGRALWESGVDKTLGLTYIEFAREVFIAMGTAESELSDVEAWLTEHRSPGVDVSF